MRFAPSCRRRILMTIKISTAVRTSFSKNQNVKVSPEPLTNTNIISSSDSAAQNTPAFQYSGSDRTR